MTVSAKGEVKILGWMGVALGGLLVSLVFPRMEERPGDVLWIILFSVGLTVLGLWFLTLRLEVDGRGVRIRNLFWRREVKWGQVREWAMAGQEWRFFLWLSEGRVVAFPMAVWEDVQAACMEMESGLKGVRRKTLGASPLVKRDRVVAWCVGGGLSLVALSLPLSIPEGNMGMSVWVSVIVFVAFFLGMTVFALKSLNVSAIEFDGERVWKDGETKKYLLTDAKSVRGEWAKSNHRQIDLIIEFPEKEIRINSYSLSYWPLMKWAEESSALNHQVKGGEVEKPREQTLSKFTYVGIIILIGVTLVGGAIVAYWQPLWRAVQLSRDAQVVEGEVRAVDGAYFWVSMEVDGTEYQVDSVDGTQNVKVGDVVRVRYSIDDPNNAVVERFDMVGSAVRNILLSVIFFGVFTALFRFAIRQQKERQYG